MLITHRKRLLSLYRIAAKYRLDTHFADVPEFAPIARLLRVHPASFGRSHQPLGVKLALEEMGTLFLKLGQLLSTRSDFYRHKLSHNYPYYKIRLPHLMPKQPLPPLNMPSTA